MSEKNLLNTCLLCTKSFDNALEFITHGIEMHFISSCLSKYHTEDLKMDCSQNNASKKRKSSEMEADGQMSAKENKSMIETNQQFGAGRVKPEKEKNTRQENEELLQQRHENDSH